MCEQKVFFGYWSSFLPDGQDVLHAPTLCTCLLKDPSSSSRVLVLQILTTMLMGSRLYLSQAEERYSTPVCLLHKYNIMLQIYSFTPCPNYHVYLYYHMYPLAHSLVKRYMPVFKVLLGKHDILIKLILETRKLY